MWWPLRWLKVIFVSTLVKFAWLYSWLSVLFKVTLLNHCESDCDVSVVLMCQEDLSTGTHVYNYVPFYQFQLWCS